MSEPVKPIPDGYEGAIPYLSIRDASAAIEFYKRAFGAVEVARLQDPDGTVTHAEIVISQAPLMLADERAAPGSPSPTTLGGTPIVIHVYVQDVDVFAERAIAAGATVVTPLTDEPYGNRDIDLLDPFGHLWSFATRTVGGDPHGATG